MAKLGEVKVQVVFDAEPLRAAVYELLCAMGCEPQADVLYAAPGVLDIPRSMADTRDGREQIVSLVQAAFEDPRTGVILIKDAKPLDEVLAPYKDRLNARTVGYA